MSSHISTPPNIESDSLPQTPYYLIDIRQLTNNMRRIETLCELSGAKALLALKCFATWSVFDTMRDYMAGTTSSSLNEVRLGKETFGKETHAYSVAYADHEIDEVLQYSDKIIFNSFSQLDRYYTKAKAAKIPVGLRLNPQISNSEFIIADPARPFSRLGESDIIQFEQILPKISGVMIHNNCENASYPLFDQQLTQIEARFGHLLAQLEWISLGGGIHFTGEGYPLEQLATRLKAFSQRYDVQVYLEPGEASITGAATLETTVIDTIVNQKPIAIVDSSIEAHMLDLLIYRESAQDIAINGQAIEAHTDMKANAQHNKADNWIICGKSCLAGDIFGEYTLNTPIKVGDRISIGNAAGYTMVKKNWFNGVAMPAIAIKQTDGSIEVVRTFGYQDYKSSLS